jgi:hypothetical protein
MRQIAQQDQCSALPSAGKGMGGGGPIPGATAGAGVGGKIRVAVQVPPFASLNFCFFVPGVGLDFFGFFF